MHTEHLTSKPFRRTPKIGKTKEVVVYTTDELIVLAKVQSISDQEITDALVHQAPGTPSAYERMLYTLAMHRPLVLRELGYCKEDAIRTAEVLHDLRVHPQQRSAS